MRPFCLLAERAAVNGHVQTCLRSDLLVSLGPVPRGEIPGWNGEFMFNFSRELPSRAPHIGAADLPCAARGVLPSTHCRVPFEKRWLLFLLHTSRWRIRACTSGDA